MRSCNREIGTGITPDNRVIDPGAPDSQDKIAGRHVHVFDYFKGFSMYHSSHTGHMTHSGTEFQLALFFDINAPFFIEAVFFPDRGVFYRVIVVYRKTFARL